MNIYQAQAWLDEHPYVTVQFSKDEPRVMYFQCSKSGEYKGGGWGSIRTGNTPSAYYAGSFCMAVDSARSMMEGLYWAYDRKPEYPMPIFGV